MNEWKDTIATFGGIALLLIGIGAYQYWESKQHYACATEFKDRPIEEIQKLCGIRPR